MAKVILINPPDSFSFEPMTYPPLGLLYIAAVLERDGFEVEIADMRKGRLIGEADYYGFTATTPQIDDVIFINKLIKSKHPDAFTFIGGAHASWRYNEIFSQFDAVFVGEAEFDVTRVLNNKIRGALINCNKKEHSVDEIPLPARRLMPAEDIVSKKLWDGERYFNDNSPVATTLITSRGCPWRCGFCANIPQKVRFRSVVNVIDEIDVIKTDYNCNHFRFLDDNFLTDRGRVFDLCSVLPSRNIFFRCSARSDLIDDHICKRLYYAGCREIGFGVESADDTVLAIIKKNETVADHRNAIKIAKENGLKVKIFMMAGLPFENDLTVSKNKWFIEDTQPDKVVVSLFTPFPGSDIYERPYNYLVDINDIGWDEYVQSYPSKSLIRTHLCTSERLTEHHRDMIKFVEEYNAR